MEIRHYVLRGIILLLVIYWTPLGGLIRPFFTSRSHWFEGIDYNATGTGFYINDHDVVTNHHVIAHCDRIYVGGRDGRIAVAMVVASDAADDLAVIRTTQRMAGVLYFSDRAAAVGQQVIYPDYTSRQGVFYQAYKTVKKLNNGSVYMGAGLREGNSGSPLMDDKGRVIGVNKAIQGDRSLTGVFLLTGYTVATPVSRLAQFLEAHAIPFTVYPDPLVNLLHDSAYKNYIAVNIGCHISGPWFTH